MNPLSWIDCCPVCGAATSESIVDVDAFDFRDGERYLTAVARDHEVSVRQLFLDVRAYKCLRCHAHYLNPWLNLSGRNRVFVSGHSIHNMGWSNFQQGFSAGHGPTLPMPPRLILDAVAARHGPVSTYVELGCPFQGLLLHLKPTHTSLHISRRTRLPITMNKEEYQRLPNPAARYLRLRGFLDRGFLRLLKLFAKTRATVRREVVEVPRISFARISSTKFWGENCSLYGNSCSTSLSVAFGIHITSIDALRQEPDKSIDLIGLFNVLDHLDDPLETLRLSLRLARVVVCCSHNQPYGIQHHVGMGYEFFNRLPTLIDNCNVSFLSEPDADEVLCLIDSRT